MNGGYHQLKKEAKRNPKPPFTTSTLQQTASNKLGFSSKATMMLAQKLYEQGLITYMRTDSTNLSPQAVDAARKLIGKEFGNKYLPEKPIYYKTKAKVAQEAHEAIRPSDFSKSPSNSKLDGDEYKLYKLIWERALASQMTSAVLDTIRIEIEKDDYLFSANGQRVKFDGYLKVYSEKLSENILPELEKGQVLNLIKLVADQHFTQPPARYSEASLIKILEEYGIGRPSTYVPIISTIQARKYVEKEGKYFVPTDTGRIVTKLLKENFEQIVDYEFTANLENELDDVANGNEDWIKLMDNFYKPFDKNLIEKDKTIERETYTVLEDAPSDIKCPECGSKMNVKLGRFGRFYSCSKWPDCKGILNLEGKTQEEVEAEATSDEFLSKYKPAPKTDEGKNYLLKEGRFGRFWAHPDYPKVKDAQPLEYTDQIMIQVYGEAPTSTDGTKMILKRGKFGEYWAHPNYPEVKETVRLNKKEVNEAKKNLGLI